MKDSSIKEFLDNLSIIQPSLPTVKLYLPLPDKIVYCWKPFSLIAGHYTMSFTTFVGFSESKKLDT